MIMKNLLTTISCLTIACSIFAQLQMNKATKKYEITVPDGEVISVDRASTGELVNRFYYWGQDEFKDVKHSIDRDDTLFRGVVFHVTQPVVKKVFGVNYTHKDRFLSYDLLFDAEKKDYTYTFTNFHYKCTEVDRNGEEVAIDSELENFKGATKRSLLDEVYTECQAVVESFQEASQIELTEAQEEEAEQWRDTRKEARDEARKAAAKAKKEAEAAAKKAAKEAAKAEKAAAKEAAAAAREKEAAEKEAAKKAREADKE
ncbi:MAG: hypothetical protein Salg2KO_06210 [Salibacteraceae bacterium]